MTAGTSHERSEAPAADERTTVPSAATPVGIETRRMRAAVEERLFGASKAPSRIGRFVVLERLGEGGMGTVWAAWDPELDRRVAIKVTRRRIDRERSVARMRREARALARLDHPNVVTVHEIDVIDDHLYIAMELVRGGTLGTWCEEHPTTQRGPQGPGSPKARFAALLDLAIQATRGLAAVHGAGMVHRDLKPSNMLVDEHGRLCLTDFGLARLEAEAGSPSEVESGDARASLDEVSAPHATGGLTRAGEILGTPAYMAPEQLEGRADALADQFSLCATLWEAAYGVRPFTGLTSHARLEAIEAGKPTLPASPPPVPAWFRTALRRGLAHDPAQRWPDVPTLLHALERGRGRRRERWLVLGGALVLAAATGFTAWGRLEPSRWCGSSEEALAGAWGSERGAAIAQHHEAAVAEELEAHVAAWSSAYERACLAFAEAAPAARDEPPLRAASDRLACLADAREQLASVADELATLDTADPLALVRALPAPTDCEARDVLATRPSSPALADAAPVLGRARVLLHAGRIDAAARALDDAPGLDTGDGAVASAFEELRAGIEAARGDHEQAEQRAARALGLAERVGDREGALRAWLRLHAAALALGRHERARLYAERAASLARRGMPASLRQAADRAVAASPPGSPGSPG